MIESDADRLALIQAVGEQFDTGKPTRMWAIFDREFIEQALGSLTNEGRRPMALARTSDVEAHELVKDSKIVRDSDSSAYFCRRFEPDGTGMTLIVLGV